MHMQQMGALEMAYNENSYIEKRQLFLRSYQFCRKRSFLERMKLSLIRMKRVVWVKLRVARKLRRFVWLRLRFGNARTRFYPLMNRSSTYGCFHSQKPLF